MTSITAIRLVATTALVAVMWVEVHWSVGVFGVCSMLGHEVTALIMRKNSLI